MGTRIEWADEVWNPVTGCSPVSEGCRNCYAERMSKRLAGRCGYPRDEPFRVTYHQDRLEEPVKWKKPRRVFVCSMGDLFHEDVKSQWLCKIFTVIFENPQHTFLVLSKRVRRMSHALQFMGVNYRAELPNLWVGVTVENQRTADERIPFLLQIPAAVRFVSVEPMLEPICLDKENDLSPWDCCAEWLEYIDWVICGGETGHGARPMDPEWARSLRDQCVEAGVPFFFKQWGEWEYWEGDYVKVGKKAAGRLMDGREWNEAPNG